MTSTNYLPVGHLESLDWTGSPVYFTGLTRKGVHTDNSCFFHAVVDAKTTFYGSGKIDGQPFDKKQFIAEFRRNLADKLYHIDSKGKKVYDKLSNGQLSQLSANLPDLSLSEMYSELKSTSPVDLKYHEYISDLLNLNIYIIRNTTRDMYYLPAEYYKKRDSIVLLYIGDDLDSVGHYELLGLKLKNIFYSKFSHNNAWIVQLRQRLKSKKS